MQFAPSPAPVVGIPVQPTQTSSFAPQNPSVPPGQYAHQYIAAPPPASGPAQVATWQPAPQPPAPQAPPLQFAPQPVQYAQQPQSLTEPQPPSQEQAQQSNVAQQLATLFPNMNLNSPEAIHEALKFMADLHSGQTYDQVEQEIEAEMEDTSNQWTPPGELTPASVKKLMQENQQMKKSLADTQAKLKNTAAVQEKAYEREVERRTTDWADSLNSPYLGHSQNMSPVQRLARKGLLDTAKAIAGEYQEAKARPPIIEQALALAAAREGINLWHQSQAPAQQMQAPTPYSLPPTGSGMMQVAPAKERTGSAGNAGSLMNDPQFLEGARAIMRRGR